MIKTITKLVVLMFIIGFITVSPRTRYIVGLSLKQISSILLWTVKYDEKEKWMIDKPRWIPIKILKPSKIVSFKTVKQSQKKD